MLLQLLEGEIERPQIKKCTELLYKEGYTAYRPPWWLRKRCVWDDLLIGHDGTKRACGSCQSICIHLGRALSRDQAALEISSVPHIPWEHCLQRLPKRQANPDQWPIRVIICRLRSHNIETASQQHQESATEALTVCTVEHRPSFLR